MYWPCGVPQIYAYHGRQCQPGDREGDSDHGNGQRDPDHEDGDVAANGAEVARGTTHGGEPPESAGIVDLQASRNDQLFASITSTRLDLWSVRPTVLLASVSRSPKSLETYGSNLGVAFKPDTSTIVLRTSESYLITYAVESDHAARVLQQQYNYSQAKRQNLMRTFGVDDTAGVGEVLLRFRRAIKIDAGIQAVIALDSELVVTTTKPAAVQCIKWAAPKDGASQAVAQLLAKMDWVSPKSAVATMVHDRAMNLSVWLSHDGHAYAVQRVKPQSLRSESSDDADSIRSSKGSNTTSTKLFEGYCFHSPESSSPARFASINARFSLIAIATASGDVLCFAAKDYAGNIPFSHPFKSSTSGASRGDICCLTWSPDGYCLFAAYEHGWCVWSVFGKEGASTFHRNGTHAEANHESWLLALHRAAWISGGAEILLTAPGQDRIWKVAMSRSAAIGCFSCANLVRALLQTPSEVTVYRGHELPDLTSISNETSLWHHAQYPPVYLHNQGPIKSAVISQDGRYVAIAGRRGVAHYSVQSGRWKTFADITVESSFAVRGGMCWFSHVLAVATENAAGYDIRLYSRELDLGRLPLHTESFSMPIVFVGPSGEDSLLVYTYENILYHYIINITDRSAQLVQVGQIAFHGIVRAPSRVRSVSWVLPDSQLRNGDPSRDVEFASVLFLVDDKLVLLQSSRNDRDELKYDMRVIAQHVEYYILMRDQIYFNFSGLEESGSPTPSPGSAFTIRSPHPHSLRDSLWIFSGDELRLWPDVRDVLHHVGEGDLNTSPLLSMAVDFYPLSILLTKGIVLGIESELLQRRDVNFAQYRNSIRTQLFLPYILRHQLCEARDTAAAFALANQYQHLSYFPHALEILLHHVLDDEAQATGRAPDEYGALGQLPAVLSFLQLVLPQGTYLSTVVQCIRKTELNYWKTLLAHLPPPLTLFEQALGLQDLKTASGYLIVLQGLEDDDESDTFDAGQFEQHVIRLMRLARDKGDFELCSELARFMMGIDPRGHTLRRVIAGVGFTGPQDPVGADSQRTVPHASLLTVASTDPPASEAEDRGVGDGDYFTASPGGYG